MEKRANDWSILGFGCMRFPRKAGRIDEEETQKLIRYSIRHGVNYFDTAYIYPGSEQVLGRILAKDGLRDKVCITTKLPHYLIRSVEDAEDKFRKQLDRLQTDHVDNYLMHMLPDVEIWDKLVRMGIGQWLQEKKQQGQIRRVGFSYHGNTDNFIRLLDAWDWDLCQVQYNYMDENSQAGRRGVEYAARKGIPVIIMEPLRGGRLADGLPRQAGQIFAQADSGSTPAQWGLRWLWDQKAVSVVLSGMGSRQMVRENIQTAESARTGMIREEQREVYDRVREAVNGEVKIPCTGCGYCQPCPAGVDIPGVFRCYNISYSDGLIRGMKEYLMTTTFRAKPANASLCVKCGRCEQNCPQQIQVRQQLDQCGRRLENPAYRAIAHFSPRFFRK